MFQTVTQAPAATFSPGLREGLLGQDGAGGHAGGQLELRRVRLGPGEDQEGEEPPGQPLRELRVAPAEAGVRQHPHAVLEHREPGEWRRVGVSVHP